MSTFRDQAHLIKLWRLQGACHNELHSQRRLFAFLVDFFHGICRLKSSKFPYFNRNHFFVQLKRAAETARYHRGVAHVVDTKSTAKVLN